MSSVAFTYTGAAPGTLTTSASFDCHGRMVLFGVAATEGGNMKIGGVDGYLSRGRTRGQLTVPLDWTVRGHTKIDGTVGAVNYFDQLHANVRALKLWFDSAPGKFVTVTLTVGATVVAGNLNHEGFDDGVFEGRSWGLQQTVTVADGVLA